MSVKRRRSGWRVAVAAAAALIVGSGAGVAEAIVGGVTTTAFPGVVGIAAGGDLLCSGFLVHQSCVVTAAHCVQGNTSGLTVFVGSSVGSPALTSAIAAVATHPSWQGSYEHDLAVLDLAQTWNVPSYPLASPPAAGNVVRVVGFGTNGVSSGTKRTALVDLTDLLPDALVTDGSAANVCEGDSGAPLLAQIGGVDTAVGVAAATDAGCSEYAVWARLDGADASFLAMAAESLCGVVATPLYASGFEQTLDDLTWTTVTPSTLSCNGRCFEFLPASECQCDAACLERGDCCVDLCAACGPCQ